MKTITLAAASLATALVLAAGTAAAAKEPPSNRGYVVGAGGVARLTNDARKQDETTSVDQTPAADTQAQRLVIKTKSSPPVAEPIGVNEPGVNRAAPTDNGGANMPVIRGSAAGRNAHTGNSGSAGGADPQASPAADPSRRGIDKKDIRRNADAAPDHQP